MNRLAAATISLLAGFAVGAWMTGSEPDGVAGASLPVAVTDVAASDDERLLQLEQVVAEEREARIALEDTLAMLFEELERVEGMRAGRPEAGAERQADTALAETSRRGPDDADRMRNYQERRVNRLVAGGFSDTEARRILQQESEASFKAMQAAWEAQRNGEGFDPFNRATNPQTLLRDELGEDGYARYLEAQGQPTAVRVTQVLDSSPGNKAGLQAGDQLVSYNGERVFNVMDLRSLTMQGQPGEDVIIEVERDGVRMQLTVPRGPIGITGTGANIRGLNWWGG